MKNKTKLISEEIIGVWYNNFKKKYFNFHQDGTLWEAYRAVKIEITNEGNTLITNVGSPYHSIHNRISGEPYDIVGSWLGEFEKNNEILREELIYRPDGKYFSIWDNESNIYNGTYELNNNELFTWDVRYFYYFENESLILHMRNMPMIVSYTYSIDQDKMILSNQNSNLEFVRIHSTK